MFMMMAIIIMKLNEPQLHSWTYMNPQNISLNEKGKSQEIYNLSSFVQTWIRDQTEQYIFMESLRMWSNCTEN